MSKTKHLNSKIRNSDEDKDYYIIRIDDPDIYKEIEKIKNEIKKLGGKWFNNSWNIPYDKKKYNFSETYKNKIDKNKELINNKIKEIAMLNRNIKKALSFDNTDLDNPYKLKIYNEIDDISQLMEIQDIELTNGCYNKKTQKFEDIENSKCKKDLNLELRPNEHKYLCNYNLHVNYPFTIDEKEIEFLPKKFSIIKPINFKEPNIEKKDKSNKQFNPYSSNYMYAFDYNYNYQDNVKTQDDDTYEKECTIKYGNEKNKFKKKEFIESCLTIDKDGLSFQDCNLRKNQRWLTSEKKTYC